VGGVAGPVSGFSQQQPFGTSFDGQPVQEIHIFIEGQGFVQDPTAFARLMLEEINQQSGRAGLS